MRTNSNNSDSDTSNHQYKNYLESNTVQVKKKVLQRQVSAKAECFVYEVDPSRQTKAISIAE